jgi:DNA-binding CsgD family transcriptional regulator/tetratricopeptide (TPR) repeat protein
MIGERFRPVFGTNPDCGTDRLDLPRRARETQSVLMVSAAPRSRRANPELIGRGQELATLEDEFNRAAAGEFRLALLLGDAGVGKSRLARELLGRHAEATGLVAQAYPFAASAAFGLWTDAMDPFLRSLADEEVVELCGGLLDDLASLFHRVAAVRGSVPERDPPLPRLLQGLGGLLANVARRRPLVVVLDDMHDADASSWQALRHLARHYDDARLLVIATSRPAELAHHDVAPQVLFDLDQDAQLTRVEVVPLGRAGLSELTEAVIERPAPRALVDWLAERSQGNPLYAIGLLRALLDERGDLDEPRLRRLPEGLTERVVSQLRRFDAAPRGLLERLAVVERPVSLGDLTALSSSSLEELEPMLAELVVAGTVVEEERGSELRYQLHHPLVRDVVYQATSGATRRVLHRQAGRSLLRAGHLAEAAVHFARSAERGDSEAVEVLLDAMRQAERREAFREALDLQAELVELLAPDDQRWLEVLEAMYDARAEWLIDHRAETQAAVAIRALRAIDGLLEGSSDHTRRALVKFRLANFLAWGTGDLEPAYEVCRQARDLFARAGDRRQTLLAARELAWIKGLQGDLAGMGAEAGAVVEAAEAADDRFVAMQALVAVGYSAGFRGAFGEAEAAQRRAVALAREDDKAYRRTTVLAQLALCVAMQGRPGETSAFFDEAKAANPAWRESILVEVGILVNHATGDFPAVVALAREAEAWRPGTPARRRAVGMARGATAAIEGDDVAEAERLLALAHAAYGGRDWSVFLQETRAAEAVLAWHAGRAAECVAILQDATGRMLSMQAQPLAAIALADLAEAAADAGDAAAAAGAAEKLSAAADFVGLPLYHGLAAAGAAWAALAAGDRASAVPAARRAIELLSTTGCVAQLARAHDALGRTLPPEQRTEAVAAFERAAALFERCGSSWRRRRSLDALRRLGSAGRRAAAAALGPDSLTRRELEVARLAATGMSAKEIAGTLFVGERTVESHLASVYAKLGVGSKLQLVRRAADLGLA